MTIIDQLLELSGAESVDEMLEQWESERGALSELADKNTALQLLNRALREALRTAESLVELLELEGGLFLPLKAAAYCVKFRILMVELENASKQSKELTNDKA